MVRSDQSSQELEIASMLPQGNGRAGVERMAEDKALLYASRWIGPQPLGLRQHALLLGTAIAGGFVTWSAGALRDHVSEPAWLGVYLFLWMVSGLELTTLGLTLWISLTVMADNAKIRAETIHVRRQRVERHLLNRGESTSAKSRL